MILRINKDKGKEEIWIKQKPKSQEQGLLLVASYYFNSPWKVQYTCQDI